MSLINEALKRTRDAAYQTGNAHPVSAESYRLAAGTVTPSPGTHPAIWVALLIAVVAGATLTVYSLHTLKQAPQNERTVMPPARGGCARPVPVVAPPAPAVAKVVEAPKSEPAPAPPPAPPQPETPKLALQGITSQGLSREALINGYEVREGDDVDGARVTSIEARRVTLRFGDKDIVLHMP